MSFSFSIVGNTPIFFNVPKIYSETKKLEQSIPFFFFYNKYNLKINKKIKTI